MSVIRISSPEGKIALFRSLFRGWEEVYPRRFVSKKNLVLELDGHQHLADEDAYRRDRRKDALLQKQCLKSTVLTRYDCFRA